MESTKASGVKFHGFVAVLKLSRVDDMLKLESDNDVISQKLGYEHVSSFYRVFKAFKGQSF